MCSPSAVAHAVCVFRCQQRPCGLVKVVLDGVVRPGECVLGAECPPLPAALHLDDEEYNDKHHLNCRVDLITLTSYSF